MAKQVGFLGSLRLRSKPANELCSPPTATRGDCNAGSLAPEGSVRARSETFKSQNSQLERNSPIKCHDRHFKGGEWHELGAGSHPTSPVRHIKDPNWGLPMHASQVFSRDRDARTTEHEIRYKVKGLACLEEIYPRG
jgi:hypothetical protein